MKQHKGGKTERQLQNASSSNIIQITKSRMMIYVGQELMRNSYTT
jgi:hypothetical protein